MVIVTCVHFRRLVYLVWLFACFPITTHNQFTVNYGILLC